MDVRQNVPSEHIFHFRDGDQAHNLQDLRDVINTMPIDEYEHHVDQFNNDFANWVEFVYKDPSLASDLRTVTSQKQAIEVLDAELGRYDQLAALNNPVAPIISLSNQSKQLFEEPVKPTSPPQIIVSHEGELHPSVSTEAVHKFIVKEFLYGLVMGLIIGLVLMAVFMRLGWF
jgi:hypothetical protein